MDHHCQPGDNIYRKAGPPLLGGGGGGDEDSALSEHPSKGMNK